MTTGELQTQGLCVSAWFPGTFHLLHYKPGDRICVYAAGSELKSLEILRLCPPKVGSQLLFTQPYQPLLLLSLTVSTSLSTMKNIL